MRGDSGGPLFAMNGERYELVGVTSFGFDQPPVCESLAGFVNLRDPRNSEWVKELVW